MRKQTRNPLWPMLALWVVSACGGDYSGRGVIEDIQRDEGQILIDHEDIPGLMPAMTMNFDVADPALLEGVEVGQLIDFRVSFDDKHYLVTSIEPLGRSGSGQFGGGQSGSGRSVAGRSGTGRYDGASDSAGFAAMRIADDLAPAFSLADQHGTRRSLAEFRGKAVLLDFIYTGCPGPCPIQTGVHVAAYDRLSESTRARIWFVSISLDPDRDDPATLLRYARKRGADRENWSFLTGTADEVDIILKAYGVGSVLQPDGELDHMLVSFVIDPQGRIAKRFLGANHGAEELAESLEAAL